MAGTMDNGLLKLDAGRRSSAAIRWSNYKDFRRCRRRDLDRHQNQRRHAVSREIARVRQLSSEKPTNLRACAIARSSPWGPTARDTCGSGRRAGLKCWTGKPGSSLFTSMIPKTPGAFRTRPVFATAEDRSGRMWFGTYGAGLDLFDRTTGRFVAWRHDPKNPDSLSTDLITLHAGGS